MKKILIILSLLFITSATTYAYFEYSREQQNIKLDKDMPIAQEIISKNDYNIWLIQDNYMPIISANIVFKKSGFAYDKKGMHGLATMVASLLDEGAGELSSIEFNQKLEEMATTISFDVDEDNFYISLTTLTENFAKSMELLSLALTKPRFDDDAIERIKNQMLIVLERQKESPRSIASTELKKLLFKNHPYSKPKYGKMADINNITKENLSEFISNNFSKENILISIAGDIEAKTISDTADKYLTLPKKQDQDLKIKEVKNLNKGVQLKNLEIPQTFIVFALNSIGRNSDNFYASYIMNYILGGGGFESNLMNEIRVKNGLAYSVYSYIEFMDKASILKGALATKNESRDKAISLLQKEIADMGKHGVSQQQLDDAKNYLIGSFPLKLTSNKSLVSFLTVMQLNDLGLDFLQKRNSYVRSVTVKQVNEVARKLLKSADLSIVSVGGRSLVASNLNN